jgi:hypothetical protein
MPSRHKDIDHRGYDMELRHSDAGEGYTQHVVLTSDSLHRKVLCLQWYAR